MRTSKLTIVLFAALCCLLMTRQTQAQSAYGYVSLTHDGSTVSGYASTEVDYDTAYYYDAEVEAHIEDENGNWLASGTSAGNPSAFTFLDVFQAALCIRFSIVSYIIVSPRFLGCDGGGRYDYWGFSDYWWGDWWDYGDFFGSRRNRCIFSRLIFIASIITDVIRCLPAEVSCQTNNPQNQILPSGLGTHTQFIDGFNAQTPTHKDNLTVTCRAVNPVTRQAQSGVVIRFGFSGNAAVQDDGGHQNHITTRPLGIFIPTSDKTNANGEVSSVYTAPQHAGIIRIRMSSPETDGGKEGDITVRVPGLEELPGPTGNDGYVLTGRDTFHPSNHWSKPRVNASLRQIGIDYRNRLFPESTNPNGVPIESVLLFNDTSLKFGGKFDIRLIPSDVPRWRTGNAHDEHRVGINCDISDRTVPNDRVMDGDRMRRRWEVVEDIFFRNGSSRTNREHCRSHWHVRFEYGGRNEPTEGCERAANPNLSTPAGGVAATVPGRVEAERFDEDNNVAGAFVPDDGSYGSGDDVLYLYPLVNPLSGGGSDYVWTVGGQWMNYTINVASSGSYTFEARVASPSSYNTFHVEIDGANVTGSMSIPNTGSGDAYQPVAFENIWLEAGRHVVSIVVEGAGQGKGNFDYFTFSPYTPPWICDPPWWETQNCQQSGGYWDYGLCACNYGGYYY